MQRFFADKGEQEEGREWAAAAFEAISLLAGERHADIRICHRSELDRHRACGHAPDAGHCGHGAASGQGAGLVVHLGWVALWLLNALFWWWWEFRLQRMKRPAPSGRDGPAEAPADHLTRASARCSFPPAPGEGGACIAFLAGRGK